MNNLFGFELSDLTSWTKFVRLLNRPEDPSSLALFRILFGILMMIDIPNERGMAEADIEYGTLSQCNFPLFDFLKPLPVQWMVILYGIMFLGALGITLGFKYRISCLLFTIPYWYIFFLDKTTWNNHSYLYGLIGIQLFITDSNRYLSIDGLLNDSIRNSHVPLWNYSLVRTQIFLVYFLAGLKKIDFDWISGYSMSNLSQHWVFDPFKYFLTSDQITVIVVHHGGLIIDLFSGYLLFFDSTRLIGTILTASFHCMNSRMFNIGMFPYAMLASTFIFYSNDWPKRLFVCSKNIKKYLGDDNKFYISKLSTHCIYDKDKNDEKNKDLNKKSSGKKNQSRSSRKSSFYHNFFSVYFIVYIIIQLFLPYSHFITKGFNNWTNGLYGYSWDMMVHSWHTQHIKVSFLDKKTNQIHYINPKAWTTRRRWSSHGDMIYQYSHCIKDRLASYNFTDIELYMDIWRSMNHRFNQRQVDPRVNLLKVKWDPFEETKWIIPLLTELSDWRTKMKEIEKKFRESDLKQNYELTFVADLHDLKLENYISNYLNASIEVLNGKINVEFEVEQLEKNNSQNKNHTVKHKLKSVKKNFTLGPGDKLDLPSGSYHNVYTISKEPSCYFYIYLNETAIILSNLFENFSNNMLEKINQSLIDMTKTNKKIDIDEYENEEEAKLWIAYNNSLIDSSKNFLNMMASNVSIRNKKEDIEKEKIHILKTFKNKNLSEHHIYKTFINQFYNNFSSKEAKAKQSFYDKYYKKLINNLKRFKHSFKMLFYACKSIFYGKDFMKIISEELFNK